MLVRIICCLIISTSLLSGCKSQKKTITKRKKPKTEQVITEKNTSESTKEKSVFDTKSSKSTSSYAVVVSNYINTYGKIAKEEMIKYGIPASITLAQGILESGAGKGELTRKANNHFGIKCHKDWTGERVYHDDDLNQECFRKYKDSKYSFRDHSLFLAERSRYGSLFKLQKDDYKGWAKGLRKAGYATDPKYPDKLIRIIEKYDLSLFDKEVLGGEVKVNDSEITSISTYHVRKGDTLYSISRKYNISVETIKTYNSLPSNDISIGQVLQLYPINN